MEARLLTLDEVMERLPVRVSERALRAKLREAGCYMQLGHAMMLSESDYAELLEALRPCHSRSSRGRKARTSTSVARSPGNTLRKAQELLTGN